MTSSPLQEQLTAKVKQILKGHLTLEVELEDIEHLDRGFNNHLYTVKLRHVPSGNPRNIRQPGTVSLSKPSSLVVRLLKTELGALPERVQNEVAALTLARGPLAPAARVPEVYAWSEGRGPDEIPFIVMQLLPGKPLDTIWPLLDLPSRLPIMRQIADILLRLRSLTIPVPCTPSTHAFGGFAFFASGSITTAVHPNSIGGPFTSAQGQWRSMLSSQLRRAEENKFIQGWKCSGLRTRVDSFIEDERGFQAILRQVAAEPVFVHGDFNCRNFFVCPETQRITGLLDFEFARIGTAPEEYMDGLEDFREHTCVAPPPDGLALHTRERTDEWPCKAESDSNLGCATARAWKRLVEDRLPMDGYEATAKMYTFLEKLCPWYFCQEPWCDAHDMVVEQQIAEGSLGDVLSAWGF